MCNCKNVGPIDRAFRAGIGLFALVLAFTLLRVTEGATGGIIVAAIGIVLLGTAAIGICPLYVPFRLSTCRSASR